MIKYVIARPYPGGLCYMVMQMFPFPPAWVPDIDLATQFEDRDMALTAASLIPAAIVEEIFVENDDSE